MLITGTVRDEEFQIDAYQKGHSKSKRPSFHAQGVGLAFDFCQNIKGHEYDDPSFFKQCGIIGERVGFEWGGRWANFPDQPHMQWSGPSHTMRSSDIWAGRRPPAMPLYQPEEEPELTQEQFNEMYEKALRNYEVKRNAASVDDWAAEAWKAAVTAGVLDGTAPQAPMTREQAAVVLKRLKQL